MAITRLVLTPIFSLVHGALYTYKGSLLMYDFFLNSFRKVAKTLKRAKRMQIVYIEDPVQISVNLKMWLNLKVLPHKTLVGRYIDFGINFSLGVI